MGFIESFKEIKIYCFRCENNCPMGIYELMKLERVFNESRFSSCYETGKNPDRGEISIFPFIRVFFLPNLLVNRVNIRV